MFKYLMTIGIFALAFNTGSSLAQGCSDAGFCSIGSFKHEQLIDSAGWKKYRNQLSLVTSLGQGDEQVFVFTPAIQYDFMATQKLSLQAKISANYASGNLGSAAGLGDVFLTGSYRFFQKNKWSTTATAGIKIPLNQSDLASDGRPFPMQYQSSLGTFDLVAGITVANQKWHFSTAWQQPLSGINHNHFLPIYWDKAEAMNYPSTNDFDRKGDILLKAARTFEIGKKIMINGGLLGIFHLGEDKYIDASESNEPIAIAGSGGLTLNITGAIWWKLNTALKIGLTGGVPLIIRDVRPDGLTRSFVISPEISWAF